MKKTLFPLCTLILLACGLPSASAATYTLSNTNDLAINANFPYNHGVVTNNAYQILVGGSGEAWAPTSVSVDSFILWYGEISATNNLSATITFYDKVGNGNVGNVLGSVTSSNWFVTKYPFVGQQALIGTTFDTTSLTNAVQAFSGGSIFYSVSYVNSGTPINYGFNMEFGRSTTNYGGGWGFGQYYGNGWVGQSYGGYSTPAVSATFITVPEPSTYALFGLGGLALVIAYRRRTA